MANGSVSLWSWNTASRIWEPLDVKAVLRTLVEASVDTGVADDTSAVNHLDDSAKNWPVNAFTDLIVEITGGTGEGQIRKIASNTATSLVPDTNFATAPDSTSTYRIGFFGKMTSEVIQLTPLEKANEHNTAELANVDILAAALSPTNTPCLFRVMIAFDVAGLFRVTTTKGGNTQTCDFNSGANLAANALYIFDHLVHSGDTINYQYSVNAQLLVLRVQEIVAGVQ